MSGGVNLDAAVALLKAAILLRDLTDAMPVQIMATMPADLSNRLMSHEYQAAFDALPDEIQSMARGIAMRDADIIAARQIGGAT